MTFCLNVPPPLGSLWWSGPCVDVVQRADWSGSSASDADAPWKAGVLLSTCSYGTILGRGNSVIAAQGPGVMFGHDPWPGEGHCQSCVAGQIMMLLQWDHQDCDVPRPWESCWKLQGWWLSCLKKSAAGMMATFFYFFDFFRLFPKT